MEKSEAGAYFDRGVNYQRAREILDERCDIPPSLEVFEAQVNEIQKRERSIAPVHVAMRIANSYHRVPFPNA